MPSTAMSSILIADDSPPMRTLLRATLRGGPYDVVEARDGDEALVLLAQHRPAIAVLDVSMPGRTGLDVCRAVRADPALAEMLLIVVSANGLDSDASAAYAAGADRFFSKPFSPRKLLETVTSLVADPSSPRGAG